MSDKQFCSMATKTAQYALKEWPAAINALETGEMILLFRKGGLYEQGSSFQIPTERALLFPSFEHQKLSMLKSSDGDGDGDGEKTPSYSPGDQILIKSWVAFKARFEINPKTAISDLGAFHIWTDDFLHQRLAWKPERPLYALICFAYRFVTPIQIRYQLQYGGCKSWIELDTEVNLCNSISVNTELDFNQRLARLAEILDQAKR
jgi:hypothetical protein